MQVSKESMLQDSRLAFLGSAVAPDTFLFSLGPNLQRRYLRIRPSTTISLNGLPGGRYLALQRQEWGMGTTPVRHRWS